MFISMAQYYIGINNQQLGPFEVDQLLANGLTPDTLVWCNGMASWEMAKNVPELSRLFIPQQPQYQQPQYQQQQYGGYQQPQYQQSQYGGGYQQPQYQQHAFQKYPNYIGWNVAIMVMSVFCCCNPISLIFGIIGLVNGTNVNKAANEGNYEVAQSKSRSAKSMAMIGTIVFIVCILLILVFYALSPEFREAFNEGIRNKY